MIKERTYQIVQKIGIGISRRIFTKSVLSRAWGKRLYSGLYIVYKQIFEGGELSKLREYIPLGSTVIDIGANIGFTSLIFSRLVGDNGSVIAFEPDPVVGETFGYNMDRRGIRNVHLFPIALGDEDGVAVLYQNESNRADNRLVADAEMAPHVERTIVKVRSLSNVVMQEPQMFQNVSFVKIDVQGYETQVLTGMTNWLEHSQNRPIIYIELWPYGLQKAGSSIEELLNILERLGYRVPSELRIRVMRLKGSDEYTNEVLIPISS
jgi:FkbM family methyltransferase